MKGKFEASSHTLLDGEVGRVPIFHDDKNTSALETKVLLMMTEIIDANTKEKGLDLDEIREQVAHMLVASRVTKNITIEDEKSASSVLVGAEETRLSARGIGEYVVPTGLFYKMLHYWTDIGNMGSQNRA